MIIINSKEMHGNRNHDHRNHSRPRRTEIKIKSLKTYLRDVAFFFISNNVEFLYRKRLKILNVTGLEPAPPGNQPVPIFKTVFFFPKCGITL